VPIELLRALAAEGHPDEPQTRARKGGLDLEQWIAGHNLEARRTSDWNGAARWVFDACPFDSQHRGGSACLLQFPSGAVSFKCFHDGCREKDWHALRDLVEPGWRTQSSPPAPRKSKATKLIELAEATCSEFFHAPDRRAYARLLRDGHREVWPVDSNEFRHFLSKLFYDHELTAPSSEALRQALNVLQGKSLFAGSQHPVYTRAAYLNPDIYLDLGDLAWRSVHIRPDGWDIVPHPDRARFRRSSSMFPLPDPKSGGGVDGLWGFCNLARRERLLFGVWLLYALQACAPYPILMVNGEEGSAKTTLAWVVKGLLDPSKAPTRGAPRAEDDLLIAAQNSHVVVFDNLSHLSPALADALCRLATGGGLSKRQLYTNDEEHVIEGTRPVLITGIEPLAFRGDLVDRALVLTLPELKEKEGDEKFKARFEAERPYLLGALLDCLSEALREVDAVKLEETPRMVDFARLGVAAEQALGFKSGEFLAAYLENRREARETLLEASSLAVRLRQFMEKHLEWKGKASELLDGLNAVATEQERRRRSWPKTPQHLSGALVRLAPSLRQVGIEVVRDREGHKSSRYIEIRTVEKAPSAASAASAPSPETAGYSADSAGFRDADWRADSADDADDASDSSSAADVVDSAGFRYTDAADDASDSSSAADVVDSVGVSSSADDADAADDEFPIVEHEDDDEGFI
jgi:hypothetical protein